MPDEEMIERISKAILETPNSSDYERLVAIRAIKALREPTEKMKLAGTRSMQDYDDSLDCWYAMIDEILK